MDLPELTGPQAGHLSLSLVTEILIFMSVNGPLGREGGLEILERAEDEAQASGRRAAADWCTALADEFRSRIPPDRE